MKLLLTKEDLEQIIHNHVAGLFTLSPEAKMEIQIGNGQVEIDINYMSVTRIPGIVAANKIEATPTTAAPAPVAAAQDPAPTSTATDSSAAGTPQKGLTASGKPDLRTAEGRALKAQMDADEAAKKNAPPVKKTGGLFGNAAPKPVAPMDAVDRATHNLTREPTAEEIEAANRKAEEAEIVAEPDAPIETEIATSEAAGDDVQEVETAVEAEAEQLAAAPVEQAAAPSPTAPRKSLFG